MTAAETFAAWALALSLDDVPRDVVHAAKRHLLDGVGCAIAAAQAREADYAIALGVGADFEATVLGTDTYDTEPFAALSNGVLVHALDFDDTHTGALVHATAAVLPAAFAVGERRRSSGREILTAAIAGYETVIRLGAAVTHGFHARGFHATSVCGVFAAALVSARLLGLGEEQIVSALGIAGSTAAGSLEFLETGSSTKQLHPGLAALNGITAARLARLGAQGPATIFEGKHGLYRSYLGVEIDPGSLTADLGTRWETTQITIKPYPCCQLSHASLDALRAAGAADPAEVETVMFAVPPGVSSIVCGKHEPRSPYEAKFSLEYCAASLLLDGDLTVSTFEPARLSRPDVLALARRVAWTHRPFDGAPADAPGMAEVHLRDGTVLRGEVAKSRGGPDAPLSDDELLAKFRGNGGTDAMAAKLLALEEQSSLREVLG